MKLTLNQIELDLKLSPRIEGGTNEDTVQDYVECFDQLPPIVVFKVPGHAKYLLADGWHRYHAAKKLELTEIEVEAKAGSYEDAKEYALLSNLRHGRPLTRKEKRHVIGEFLKIHPERANKWIAIDLGSSHHTVKSVREELEKGGKFSTPDYLLTKDGQKIKRGDAKPSKEPEQKTPETESTEPVEDPEIEPEPEMPPTPMVGKYELDTIHQVDVTEGLLGLPEESIDLFFADPPYNLNVKYGEDSDNKPSDQYFAWCSQWFMGVYRALKTGGAFYVMHYPETAARWMQLLTMFGFRRWITWIYNSNIGQSDSNWRRSQRTILYYTKGQTPLFFDGKADPQPYKNPDDQRVKHLPDSGTTPYDWWEYNLVKNVSKDKTNWPNQIPVGLVKRIILSSCPEEGIVCDPFMGSGSTAIAAMEADRKWIGFDKEKNACEITRNRIAKTQDERTT